MRWVVGVFSVLLVAGCASGADQAADPPSSSPSQSSPSASAPSPAYTVAACDDEVRAAMERTITGQQDAFARRDFAQAREFASESFRTSITTEQFKALIEREYGFLLTDPAVTFDRCAQVEDIGEIQVRVPGTTPRTLVYRLVREPAGWAIDGARITGTSPGVAA